MISRLAEKNLTPAAKAAVTELLAPGESLADASTWADEVRGRMRETAPWLYVDVPLDWPRYDPKFSGPTVGCVVDKINEFRRVIKDEAKPVKDRRFALRFLIHCIEDMHQPCHVGDNHAAPGRSKPVPVGSDHPAFQEGRIREVPGGRTPLRHSGQVAASMKLDPGLNDHERTTGPHGDRFGQVHPASIADRRRGNPAKPLDLWTSVVAEQGELLPQDYLAHGLAATKIQVESIAVDPQGDIFIADFAHNVIREVCHATGLIVTVAGNGKLGCTGDGGAGVHENIDLRFMHHQTMTTIRSLH